MKIYAVGGAIRDAVMGVPINDIDYVVVGATAEQMISLGYRPVGKDFPVFLHPKTQAEYALARTERKTGIGYQGFHFYADPSVTLEQDLQRRDLTMNAMARSVDEAGSLVGPILDPYGGQADIKATVFRHVSAAFAEDPLRLWRIARFAARFPEFSIAPETLLALKAIAASGELSALSPERLWQELSRGMASTKPLRMLEILIDLGAADRVLPAELVLLLSNTQEKARLTNELDLLRLNVADVDGACAIVLADVSEDAIEQWAQVMRVPHEVRDFAQLFSSLKRMISKSNPSAEEILAWFNRADVWRKLERAERLVRLAHDLKFNATATLSALRAVQNINNQDVLETLSKDERSDGERIRAAMDAARLSVISKALH